MKIKMSRTRTSILVATAGLVGLGGFSSSCGLVSAHAGGMRMRGRRDDMEKKMASVKVQNTAKKKSEQPASGFKPVPAAEQLAHPNPHYPKNVFPNPVAEPSLTNSERVLLWLPTVLTGLLTLGGLGVAARMMWQMKYAKSDLLNPTFRHKNGQRMFYWHILVSVLHLFVAGSLAFVPLGSDHPRPSIRLYVIPLS
eukprot:g16612.t1